MPSTFLRSFILVLSRNLLLLLTVSLFFLSFCSSVYAQEVGVSIKPAMIEESLDPGNVKQYSFTIENLDSKEVTYYLFTRNISGVKSGGVPIFARDDNEKTGYELSDWITLEKTEVTLDGGGSISVSFTVDVPENASPGSHFGGIFVSVDAPDIEKSGAAVGYQVANIISLRISGEVVEQANIRQFSTDKFLYGSQNVDFSVRIENTGNVLVRPVGPLEIYNMLGNRVGTLVFNENQSAVFPHNIREFDNIKWEGNSIGFGRYEAILSPLYGDTGAKQTMSSTVTFWILPMNIIGPALGVLAVILLVTFVFVRIYIRRSLEHLNHGRRLVRRRRRGGSSAVLLVTVVMLTATALFLIVLLALFA